jgi:hypothetical protein
MKTILNALILLMISQFSGKALAQKLSFTYDPSGSQAERRWVCINCRPAQDLSINSHSKTKSVNQNDKEVAIQKSLKVFPNPATEQVNLVWQIPGKVYLQEIVIYDISGKKIYSGKYSPDKNDAQIALHGFPSGTYLLVVLYSDGSSESVKLIKM